MTDPKILRATARAEADQILAGLDEIIATLEHDPRLKGIRERSEGFDERLEKVKDARKGFVQALKGIAPMILVRSFRGDDLDLTTDSERAAAEAVADRAERYGWDDVQVDFGDGSRPLGGLELILWVERHFPEFSRRVE